jgi:hypothetical protein
MGLLKCGGCLLIKAGITRLSELTIDAGKDWQGFGITNVEEISPAAAKGDSAVRGNIVLDTLTPGVLGRPLTSQGPGNTPTWG